jgi:hypothetical protein
MRTITIVDDGTVNWLDDYTIETKGARVVQRVAGELPIFEARANLVGYADRDLSTPLVEIPKGSFLQLIGCDLDLINNVSIFDYTPPNAVETYTLRIACMVYDDRGVSLWRHVSGNLGITESVDKPLV